MPCDPGIHSAYTSAYTSPRSAYTLPRRVRLPGSIGPPAGDDPVNLVPPLPGGAQGLPQGPLVLGGRVRNGQAPGRPRAASPLPCLDLLRRDCDLVRVLAPAEHRRETFVCEHPSKHEQRMF
jgi:hypothetical protein